MADIRFIIKRLGNIHLKSFTNAASRISKITGKSKIYILKDIVDCYNKHGSGPVDYETFEMYNMNEEERSNILTIARNNAIVRKLNDPAFVHYLDNKPEFNEKFAKYVKRGWIVADETNRDEFIRFIEKYDKVILKPLNLSCGSGIEKIYKGEDGKWSNKHLKDISSEEVYKYVLETGKTLVEEVLDQVEEMNRLAPYAINTIRLYTILNKDGVEIVAGCVRIAIDPDADVDNFNHGGISTVFDLESGVLLMPAFDKWRKVYEVVPATGTKIVGYQLPRYKEACELVKEAAKELPEVRYIAWDICVSETYGLCLIEGNAFPGQDAAQVPSLNLGTYGALKKAIRD